MGFWNGFISADNSNVNTPYAAMALAFVLATPIVGLSCSIIITHFFIRGHALDAPTVDLLKYLLGSATGIVFGAGATVFSKTTMTNITGNILSPGETTKPRGPKPDSL